MNKNNGESSSYHKDFLRMCNQELLAQGTDLLKRTRNGTCQTLFSFKIFHSQMLKINLTMGELSVGELYWKILSVYIYPKVQRPSAFDPKVTTLYDLSDEYWKMRNNKTIICLMIMIYGLLK